MKAKQLLCSAFLVLCMVMTVRTYVIVNAGEQMTELEIKLEDESTTREGVVFSLYQVTDGIVPKSGDELTLMPDFEGLGHKLSADTAKEVEELIKRLSIWIENKNVTAAYTLTTDEQGLCSISGIPFGMYLIVPSSYEEYALEVESSLLFIPGFDENKELLYNRLIIPKHVVLPQESTTEEETTAKEKEEASSTTAKETTSWASTESTADKSESKESSEDKILGIEDSSGRMGMIMITLGICLLMIAMVLMLKRSHAE